jgi:biotin carboxyl carrier protein
MAAIGTRGNVAVKRDVLAGGKPAKLEIDGPQLRYFCGADPLVRGGPPGPPLERKFDLQETEPGLYSVLVEGRSYEVIVLQPGEVSINGRTLTIEVFDPRALRGRRDGDTNDGPQNIAASMPGKVIRVLVAAGDSVAAGQGLIVVEAMKMQNEMKSPKAGRVVEVRTSAGATVAAGEVLVVIE